MEHEPTKNSASQKVLQKILAKEVEMRPRAYFTLKALALGVVAFITLVLSVSIGSFILFSLRASSDTSLLGFGPPGYIIFLYIFPWWLLFLDILCIVALEWMLRKFRFGYKSPLLYLLFAILVITFSITTTLDRTHLSDDMLQSAQHHNVPGIGGLYDQGRRPPPPGSGACPCQVVAINTDTITMQEAQPDGTSRQVIVTLPLGTATSSIQVGQSYFVIGHYQDGILEASGLQPMNPGGPQQPQRQPQQTENQF